MQKPEIWDATVIVITLNLALFAATCFSAERPCPASPWKPRPVGPDEIRDKRGAVEDQLRQKILAGFKKESQLTELRRILNAPWDRAGVEQLGKIVLDSAPVDGKVEINDAQWPAIANMIAYVGTTRAGTPAAAAAREVFDRIMERAIITDRRKVKKADFWGCTADAIAKYGSAELLTESFWKGMESGLSAEYVIEAVGDEGAHKRFKNMQEKMRPVLLETQIAYPELLKIGNSFKRFEIGKRIQEIKGDKAEGIKKMAEEANWEHGDYLGVVIYSIYSRMKKGASTPTNCPSAGSDLNDAKLRDGKQ